MSYSHTLPGEANTDSFARFYMDKQENAFQSRQQGHAVFDDVEMVEIIIPGDSRTQFVGLVNDSHRNRWPHQYRAFKEGLKPAEEGSPIEHWAAVTAAQAANLKAIGVHTVEALAAVSDGNLGNIGHAGMGARELRERARKWLEQAKSDAPLAKALADLEDRNAEIAALKNQLSDMSDAVRRLEAKIDAK